MQQLLLLERSEEELGLKEKNCCVVPLDRNKQD